MRRTLDGRLAVLVVGALALAGCGSGPERQAGGDGAEAGGATPAGSAEAIGMRELDAALKDFLTKLDERAARGWPPEVKLTSDAPPRPLVKIDFVNRTRGMLDGQAWTGRISDELLRRGTLAVVLGDGPPDAAGALRLVCEVSDERSEVDGVVTTDHWIFMKLVDPSSPQVLVGSRSTFRSVKHP